MQCSEMNVSQRGVSSRLATVEEEVSEWEDMETEHSIINCGRKKGWKRKNEESLNCGTVPGSAVLHTAEVSKGKQGREVG